MKKILQKYIDFILFIVLLILISIVSAKSFKRFDLTRSGVYSISNATKTTVKTLTEPLSVHVFFSENLPSPYNETYQYVKDILAEYGRIGNKNFSYKFYNMKKAENEKIASDYGLSQVRIQEAKTNEVGFKLVWMGLAIVYGPKIEVMNGLSSQEGFEYNLTTNIAKLVSTTDTLSELGSNEKVSLTLYVSEELKDKKFAISGMSNLEKLVGDAYNSVNVKNLGRIDFKTVNPTSFEAQEFSEKYGIPLVSWENKDKTEGKGILGLVLSFGEKFKVIPLSIQSSFFGNAVSGFENLENNLNDAIVSLFSKNTEIGYITGHGELDTVDSQTSSDLNFVSNLSDMYSLKTISLNTEQIPGNLNTIVIAGAKSEFTDEELYKIDQFLLNGGNVMIFQDAFDAVQTNPYMMPSMSPLNSNLNKILEKYGVKIEQNYVFDEKCFVRATQQYGNVNFYYAPTVTKENILSKNPISKNLDFLIFIQASSIDVKNALENDNLSVSVLAKSSPLSWTQSENINISNPLAISVPQTGEKKSENLAVLIEGKFNSAFEKNPSEKEEKSQMKSSTHLAKSSQNGKLFILSTSQVLENNVFDKNCQEPIAMFVRNAFDYMNGNSDLCTMRTKNFTYTALKTNLSDGEKVLQSFLKYFCQFGLPLLVVLAGVIVFFVRKSHRNQIHKMFNPDDRSDSFNEKK